MRVFALFAAACSLGVTPPPKEPHGVPQCTTSGMLPSFDTLNAVSQAVGGTYYATQGNRELAATTLAVGAVYAAAAWYGWHTVRACRRATESVVHEDTTEARAATDCSHVREIALKLAQDAPDDYVVFIHDPALASCF